MNGEHQTNYWRFLAGPESTLQYVLDRRPTVAGWTVDRSGRAAPGDVVLLFGTGSLQQCVALARVCSPALENFKAPGRHRKANREWWAFLQVQPLRQPVPRAEIEALPAAKRPSSGLQQARGSRANRISAEAAAAALELLIDHDPKVRSRVRRWQDGSAKWPRHLDLEDLRYAVWEAPEARQAEEVRLCERIAEHLVRGRLFRYLSPDDGVGEPLVARGGRSERSWLSLEHRVIDEAGTGRIDILLVDEREQTPTLLAIEVKLHARPVGSRNPIPQIIRYRGALEQRNGREWAVKTMVIAQDFSDLVTDEARSHGIPLLVCTSAGKLRGAVP